MLLFAKYAAHVVMVVRGEILKSSVSAYLVDRICSAKSVELLTNTEVDALEGDKTL
jgi:thioredoxin reductase (NADPH)